MRKSKKDRYDPFVKLDYEMLDSAAWKKLSDSSIWCYIELKKSFSIIKDGSYHLTLPYRKHLYHHATETISKSLKELLNFGFIDVIQRGGLFKKPSIYRLSDRWKQISCQILAKKGG